MSVSSGLSGRYAKALYELAKEKKILSKIVDDFMKLKKLLEEKGNDTKEIWSSITTNEGSRLWYA